MAKCGHCGQSLSLRFKEAEATGFLIVLYVFYCGSCGAVFNVIPADYNVHEK